MVAVPLHPPLQSTFVCDCVEVGAVGPVMLNVCVPVQPEGFVTVHVYVPGHKLVAVAPVPPEGSQAYVNGPEPEVTLVVAVPLHATQEVELVCEPDVVKPAVTVTVTLALTTTGLAQVVLVIVQV